MSGRILLGPLLGLESDTLYTVCFLVSKDTKDPQVVVNDNAVAAKRIQKTPSGGVFWRAKITLPARKKVGSFHRYRIESAGSVLLDPRKRSEWKFWVPGDSEEPRIAYASCNGFASGDAKTKLDEPYEMWKRMVKAHEREPFALLVMGGDQIYADELWHSPSRVPSVEDWSKLSRGERKESPVKPSLQNELDSFYENLYIRHWNQEDMSMMMASVPSVMMWDDHDIFDGWGSYPNDLQTCDVYKEIFKAARRYFELFQIRSKENTTLLNPDRKHYSFALRFRNYGILGIDNRSDRTETVVMSVQNWSDTKGWIRKNSGRVRTLLVLSAVPVVYRKFSMSEAAFDSTPWQEQLTDDIRDHWRSRYHEGERMKLIMNLLKFNAPGNPGHIKRIILSGDVHVGCMGIIRDHHQRKQKRIYQVVSSAIVHPAPSRFYWWGICAGSNDDPESLEGGQITTELLEPYGSSDKFLRTRNYAILKEGDDNKLWITWVCEDGRTPEYPIAGSA